MIRLGVIIFIFTISCFQSFSQQNNALVDYRADLASIKDQGEYTELIGNVVFYHNGVFITCDTAYRYSEQRMEGIGNVIINSDSTFVYGDKFLYNGVTNIAEVYAPLIKTIDGDAVMYTHNMSFNTLLSSGTYHSGGTSTQGTNIMESERGVYFSSDRSILLSGVVNMKNENYEIKSDTISYNFDTKIVTFLDKAHIWNHKGEFLVAEDGTYDIQNEVYDFYNDAYIMTTDKELWADSILYQSRLQSARLDENIQILDTIQRVLSLGDKANYWGVNGRVLITKDPATISYGELKADSVFLRADTMLVVPMLARQPLVGHMLASDTVSIDGNLSEAISSLDQLQDSTLILDKPSDTILSGNVGDIAADTLSSTVIDEISTPVVQDTTISTKEVKPLSKRELAREQKRKEKELKDELKYQKRLDKAKIREVKRLEKLKRIVEKQKAKGKYIEPEEITIEEVVETDTLALDSPADSLEDGVRDDIVVKREADSSDHFIYALHNVKSFKKDMQMACDSMVINSLDSTTTLYITPIIWSQASQITAEYITLFTKNEAPYKAEMYGFPILAQAMRDKKYNQIRGKYMEAYFKGQSIDVLYVDGNSECIYYKEEGEPGSPLDAISNVVSANMEIYFEEAQMSDLKWFSDVKFSVYPIDKMNEETKETVEGFEWKIGQRPTSSLSITKRIVKPSKRAVYSKLEKPMFTITAQIDGEKESFTKDGIWKDRSEPLPINKAEFFNTQPK